MKLLKFMIKNHRLQCLLAAFAFSSAASALCSATIKDAPLLLSLIKSACYVPCWICIFWPRDLVIGNGALSMPKLSLVWLCGVVIIGGMGALSLASDIYRAAAEELTLFDAAGTSTVAIQALQVQAEVLDDLASDWLAISFSTALAAGLIYALFRIRANLAAIAAALKNLPPVPQPDPDHIFVVGDRNQQATAVASTAQTG